MLISIIKNLYWSSQITFPPFYIILFSIFQSALAFVKVYSDGIAFLFSSWWEVKIMFFIFSCAETFLKRSYINLSSLCWFYVWSDFELRYYLSNINSIKGSSSSLYYFDKKYYQKIINYLWAIIFSFNYFIIKNNYY